MRHHYQLTVGMVFHQPPDRFVHSVAHFVEGLGREGQIPRMIEVGIDLSREEFLEILPADSAPPRGQPEFGELIYDLDIQLVRFRDGPGGLRSSREGRRANRPNRAFCQVRGRRPGLGESDCAQPKLLEIGIHDVIRVLYFAVSDQVHLACHRRRV